MSASISTKKKNVGMDFLKQAAGHLSGAASSYISDVMPNTSSTLKEAKSTVSTVSAAFINTSQSILPKMRQLKTQMGFRNISTWFMEKEEEYGAGDSDSSLNFDIQTDSADIAEAQISEIGKNANQVSQAVVESSHKMVEAQLAATANLMSTAEKQTAVITAGFDKTNETLNKILEVLTKNTATLIETTVAANSNRSANDELASGGTFNLATYKKMVGSNFKNSQIGVLASMAPALLGDSSNVKDMLSPKNLIQAALGFAVDKKAPNLKKNLAALDQAVSDTIMTSLIRLGENDSFGLKGELSRMFGIDSRRKAVNTSRSSLELKTVPFDSIAHEAITNALPGYLRKILVALGGPDVVYDYRSRSFKTKAAIHKEFRNAAVSRGTIYNASSNVRKTIGSDQFSTMAYDMMMADLGGNTSGGGARNTIKGFADSEAAEKYVMELLSKVLHSPEEERKAKMFAANVSKAASGMGAIEMANQVASTNVNRNIRMQNFVGNANAHNVDLSGIRDIPGNDKGVLAADYIRSRGGGRSDSSLSIPKTSTLTGLNYTNVALYEIFRKLNDGINVFQVGSSTEQSEKFKYRGDEYLAKPIAYKPKTPQPATGGSRTSSVISGTPSAGSDEANLLQNQQLEDGTTEELTGGQRFVRWGKKRGTGLAKALFSGSPEQVKEAFGLMVRDISQVASDGIKKGTAKINDSFGNVSGYLKHKMFGTEYSYDTTDAKGQPITKHIAANEKGGVFGWVKDGIMESFTSAKEKSSKWISSVLGYFDYGDGETDKSEDGTAKKRKKLLTASLGAFAGAGILGGPIGLLVGAMAGNALASAGIGKKIKNLLFGHDEETGKPTGLISKAADAIISPIKFQLGKTIAFAGGILKKNVFGPLADIGLALKDRITNHVDSVFKKISDTVLKPFKDFGKWMLGGIAKIAAKGVSSLLNLGSTTMPGKMARGAMGVAGSVVGGLQSGAANSIAGRNSFHTLKRDEEYTIKKGEVYLDPDGKKKRANEDMTVTGAMGIKVQTRAYLDARRKSRKAEVRSDLEESGYYESGRGIFGRVKGFFGGDYNKWHEADLKRRQGRRNKLGEYTNEREKTKEELLAEQQAAEARRIAENTERQAEQGARMAEDLGNLAEEGLTEGSIYTHDKGMQDRLDDLIELFGGKRRGSAGVGSGIKTNNKKGKSDTDTIVDALKANSADNERDSFSMGALNAAATLAGSGDVVTNDESRLATAIFDEAGKAKSNKQSIGAKLKELMNSQKKKLEAATEKKETIFDKIFNFLGDAGSTLKSLLPLGGVIAALIALFKTGGLGDILDRLGVGVNKFLGLFSGEDKDGEDPTTVGMNMVSSIADVQAKSSWDYATPFKNLYHNNKDAAGNRIENSSATEAKEELLWKMNARHDIIGSTWNNLRASSRLNTADRLYNTASAQRAQGGLWNNTKAKVNELRGDRALQQSLDAEAAANAPKTSTISGIGRAFGRIGVINAAGNITGGIAGNIASGLGANEETSAAVSRVTNAATSGALTVNAVKSSVIPGKKAWVDKVLDGITSMFKFIGEKVGADKALKAVGSTKVVSAITGAAKKITGAIASKFDDIIVNKIATKLAALGVKNAATVATAGIAIAAGAIVGLASGFCGTEHLFGVLPGDADAGMRTISSLLGAAFGALEWTPAGWIVVILDVIDAILIAIPGIECGIKQFLARKIYELFGGAQNLSEKQAAFESERQHYKETYGVDMNSATFNDAVNSTGFLDSIWNGSVKKGEDGHLNYDKAGGILSTGGMKSWFVGGEKKYATDEQGNVLRDANNNAVQAVDKYGRGLKEDTKWGDHVGNFFGDVGRWFAGGTEYEVDENGQAIRDPKTGELVVKEKSGNIFQRGGAAISDWWNGKEVTNPDGSVTKTKGFAEAASTTLGNIGSAIAKPFQDAGSAIAGWWGGKEEIDANGNPILDENGNPVKKGGFKDWALSGLGKFAGTAGNLIKGVTTGAKEWILGDYERDADGNPLLDENQQPIRKGGLVGWVKGGLGKLNETFVKPAKEMIQGAGEWISEKAEWVGEGLSSAKDWIVGKASNLWTNISTPVKEAAGAAGAWIADKASWIGDKAKDIGGWISEKAGTLWKNISEPVKDAASAAADWVSNKAAWIGDKAKDVKDWIGEKAGKLFGCITDNVKGLVDGASEWVNEKATWIKDGVKDVGDWIGQKAASIWDWITGGINKVADKGEQARRDEEYIRSQQGAGGGGARVGGVGGPLDNVAGAATGIATASNTDTNSSLTQEGGNPLNKPFTIPDGGHFGPRILSGSPDNHYGVDLNAEGETEVGARYNGVVDKVITGVTGGYLGHPQPTGNMVRYRTDDGKYITYMHLKEGSIPDSIKPGARISIGDKVGMMGHTGNSTGKHLHYQINVPSSGTYTRSSDGAINPEADVMGGSTLSSFVPGSNTTYPSGMAGMSSDGTSTVSNSNNSNGEGPLARLISSLKNLGARFLSVITGGLLGDSLAGSPSSEIVDAPTANFGDYSQYSGNCTSVNDFLKICANEIGTTENPAGSNKTKYGEWYGWNGVAWCMIFVQWCFNQAGLTLEHKSASCSDTLEWWQKNHPAQVTDNPKPGDIMIQEGHTGIVEKVGELITTIEGNTSPTDKGSQNNGGCVARKQRKRSSIKKFIRPVDFEALSRQASQAASAAKNVGEGAEGLWKYFKSLGYSDQAIAGILGCWTAESGNTARRVEWDYSGTFKNTLGYDRVLNDRVAMDRFTQELFNMYQRGGHSIKRDAYYDKSDGHYYPGIGYAQWTGPRGKKLLDYARKNNLDWGAPATQLAYLDTELNGSYAPVKTKLQSAKSPEDAAGIFCSGFEGYNGSGVAARKANARNLMSQFGGKYGVGGVISSKQQGPTREDLEALRKEYGDKPNNTGGVGGGSIGKTSYRVQGSSAKRSIGGGSSTSVFNPVRMFNNPSPSETITSGIPRGGSGDISRVIDLMAQMIVELSAINNNTGTSSDLLGALNEKGFVDQGLRDSLTAVSKQPRKNYARHTQTNQNSVRAVTALARP